MAESEPKPLPSSLPLIAVVGTIAAAILISRLPLESTRPSPPSGLEPAVRDFNGVDAMLWQDPMEVVLDHVREFHCGAPSSDQPVLRPCSSDHCISQVGQRINKLISTTERRARVANAAVHILMVMVRDEQFAEDHERRLRNRYTLLTALRAAGMEPEEGKHIHYFTVSPEEWEWSPRPIAFPCEWFQPEGLYTPNPRLDGRPERVLTIWLPQSAFEGQPLRKIVQLLKAVGGCVPEHGLFTEMGKPEGRARVDLIGPSFSTVLRDMLREIHEDDIGRAPLDLPATRSGAEWLRIYSPWATASPVLLAKDWHALMMGDLAAAEGTSAACMLRAIPEIFAKAHIRFIRMIGTDDLLALHLINELGRRNIDVVGESDNDHVALISEWDTFYGKAFPLTFAAMMSSLRDSEGARDRHLCGPNDLLTRLCASRQREPNWITYSKNLAACLREPERLPRNLHLYTYLNGIDGRLPPAQGQPVAGPEAKNNRSVGSAEAASRWAYGENLELPIGQGQLDYARRLAQRLHDEFRGLRQSRLKAIGVVGSDVYDKLILLHALREEFGNTLLFTTDLDARLLHHEQFQWTRNVVVASNFGLELPSVYYEVSQQPRRVPARNEERSSSVPPGFPPFRDNYQTALFLACRTALGLHMGNVETSPLLRDFTPDALARLLGNPRIFEIGHGRPVDLSVSASPEEERLHLQPRTWKGPNPLRSPSLLLVCLSFVMFVSIPLAGGLQAIARWGHPREGDAHKRRFRYGELFAAVGRLLAVALVVSVFIGLIVHDHYAQPDGEPFSLSSGVSAWPGLTFWLIGVIVGIHFVWSAFRIIQQSNAGLARDFFGSQEGATSVGAMRDGQPENVTEDAWHLWNDYLTRGRPRRRFWRAFGFSILFAVETVALMRLLGLPHTACRGVLSCFLYRLLAFCVLSLLLLLLFFAVDAIRLWLHMIDRLIAHERSWPPDPTDPGSDREGWMDVRLIARMTEPMGKLLCMPATILLLVIAGRFWYFDSWGFPVQVVLVYAAIALWLGICAVLLQLAARQARTTALNQLTETLRDIGFDAGDNKTRANRIKAVIEDIRSIRQGAFRPLAENPVVHFMLIPSGGVGLLALLTYLLPR